MLKKAIPKERAKEKVEHLLARARKCAIPMDGDSSTRSNKFWDNINTVIEIALSSLAHDKLRRVILLLKIQNNWYGLTEKDEAAWIDDHIFTNQEYSWVWPAMNLFLRMIAIEKETDESQLLFLMYTTCRLAVEFGSLNDSIDFSQYKTLFDDVTFNKFNDHAFYMKTQLYILDSLDYNIWVPSPHDLVLIFESLWGDTLNVREKQLWLMLVDNAAMNIDSYKHDVSLIAATALFLALIDADPNDSIDQFSEFCQLCGVDPEDTINTHDVFQSRVCVPN